MDTTDAPAHQTPLHHHDSTSSSIPLSASLLPFEAITAENLLEKIKKKHPNMRELSVKKWPCYQNNIESLYSLCLFFRMSAMMIPFVVLFCFLFCWVCFARCPQPAIWHTHTCTHTHTHTDTQNAWDIHINTHTPAYTDSCKYMHIVGGVAAVYQT